MENIRQAVERARTDAAYVDQQRAAQQAPASRSEAKWSVDRSGAFDEDGVSEVLLNEATLESKRVISYNSGDVRTKAFDMLRTQILREMDLKDWKIIGITSPTPGCGKTVTSLNLALSISRLPDRDVVLIDMDLLRPQVANCLGITCENGVIGVLEGRAKLSDAVLRARVGNNQSLLVLPTRKVKSGSAEWMASTELGDLMKSIRSNFGSRIVIVDMSPMLSSDDAMTLLPHLDCVLLVAAAGKSSIAEISEANKHLQSANVVRLVLNKLETPTPYHYYYY